MEPTERGRAYIVRMTELLGDREPLDVMGELAGALCELLDGLCDAELRAREAPDKWSIVEVVHHLADTELVYGYRLRMALTLDTPRFEQFDQKGWVERFGHLDAPIEPAMRQLEVLRPAHIALARGIGPDDATRAGVHTSRGLETVERMLTLWAAHDLAHRRQIARIRQTVT